MSDLQRANRIRHLNARLMQIDAERRQIVMDLLPLENAESWSMGFRVPLRGPRLVTAMDARDEIAAARAA